MKSYFVWLFILLSFNAVELAQADAKGYDQLRIEVVPKEPLNKSFVLK
jgi:hypothetical protein